MVEDYTGLCATASCIDVDGYGSSGAGVTTFTASAFVPTNYTNELLVAINGTLNDESLTPIAPCFNIDPGSTEGNPNSNTVTGQIVISIGTTPSCGVTWTGGDRAGIFLMSLRTAQSSAAAGSTVLAKTVTLAKSTKLGTVCHQNL
jgi:hypothetical protein